MAGSAFFIRGAETQKTHAELSLNIVWKNIIFEMKNSLDRLNNK